MFSSMIVKAAALKPEIRLAQSVSEFEASLSDAHKATFQSYRSQSLDKPPDPSDVMRLTAEIDRRVVQQNGGGQCFGPRLTNILQAVQQYAALGDVIVGGSQNIIACGIWSLLRLTLLALVSFSSYMEKLSKLLMVAGRKAPRYEQMALLYPRSSDLQSNLSEYFIVVVQLCRMLYKATQKTKLGSYFSFFSDLDLKEHETSLQLWADCIKDEVTLLTARKITEQTTFLGVLSKNSDEQSHREQLRTRFRVLEACSTYDPQTTWKEIRKSGNSTILAQLGHYAQWKAATASSTLLCTGKLGFGKSVLLANMVDELNLSTESTDTAVIYFFCRHDIQESLRARTIIGSITRQLINANPSRVPDEFIDTNSVSNLENLVQFIVNLISGDEEAYLVLDGLDECDEHERVTTLEYLKRLQEVFTFKICCSFRSDVHIKEALKSAGTLLRSRVTQLPEENPDISTFVTAELERCIESGSLCISDPTLAYEIQQALVNRSQGMFLWTILQIASLCMAPSDAEIREALEDLPKGLPETFSRIMKKSQGTGESFQRKIFQLCLVARRPLTTEELREALSVVPYNTEWNPARLINDIFSLLPFCGSLITIDEEELTVRFLHHSVKQYLLGEFDLVGQPILTWKDANETMGEIVVTYLNYNTFENALSSTVFAQMMAQDMPSIIVKSAFQYPTPVQKVALSMFTREPSYQHDLRDTLIRARSATSQNVQFKFHTYAQANWLWHVKWIFIHEDDRALDLLMKILNNTRVNINDKDDNGESLLFEAVKVASSEVVERLLDYSSDVHTVAMNGRTALHLAAMLGREDIIKCLLRRGAKSSHLDKDNCTPLFLAVLMGHQEAVGTLVRVTNYGDLNIKHKDGMAAISLAAFNGNLEIVMSLLVKGAGIETKDKDSWTPLMLAARAGQRHVVKCLLDRGARVNTVDEDGWTALHWAAFKGHRVVTWLLIGRRAVIEAQDRDARTPLLLATLEGHGHVVRQLVENGANIQAEDKDGHSALQIAHIKGHETIKQFLYRKIRGIAINSPPSDRIHIANMQGYLNSRSEPIKQADDESQNMVKSTDLFWAADHGYDPLVTFLIKRGAHIEVQDEYGATPLLHALAYGHLSTGELLLEGGANVQASDSGGRTALHVSVERGELSISRLLLENGANVQASGSGGRTALHVSVKRGELSIVGLLLEHGANVHANKSNGKTALHIAAKKGDRVALQLLLNNGARAGARTPDGSTALHLAAKLGHVQVVECLVDHGADMGAETLDGKTALLLAMEHGKYHVVQYLLSRGVIPEMHIDEAAFAKFSIGR